MSATRGPGYTVRLVLGLAVVWLSALGWCGAAGAGAWGPFSDPQPVDIEGYLGAAEEPFITPDGRYLLFNSSEAEPDFALEYASRVDAQAFDYQAEISGEGVNQPESLSGTPSLDEEGELFFVSSPRSYFETLSTVYCGHFAEGAVTGVHLVSGVAGESLGKVDFDVGVSPDGSALYVSVGQFGEEGGPSSARIVIFERDGTGFVRSADSEAIMHAVNDTATLDYGADLSYDGLELFFTAASPALGEAPDIYRATRSDMGEPFGDVERIAAITGFAEAPSITADDTTLYYHEQVGGRFVIMTVTRPPGSPPSIRRLSQTKGPAAGGSSVTITGANFTGVTAVDFGAVSAAKFTYDSPTSITAVSPQEAPGKVRVSVTSPAGTSAATKKDRFTFRKPRSR